MKRIMAFVCIITSFMLFCACGQGKNNPESLFSAQPKVQSPEDNYSDLRSILLKKYQKLAMVGAVVIDHINFTFREKEISEELRANGIKKSISVTAEIFARSTEKKLDNTIQEKEDFSHIYVTTDGIKVFNYENGKDITDDSIFIWKKMSHVPQSRKELYYKECSELVLLIQDIAKALWKEDNYPEGHLETPSGDLGELLRKAAVFSDGELLKGKGLRDIWGNKRQFFEDADFIYIISAGSDGVFEKDVHLSQERFNYEDCKGKDICLAYPKKCEKYGNIVKCCSAPIAESLY